MIYNSRIEYTEFNIAATVVVPAQGALSDDAVWRLTPVAYIWPKSRTERPRKTIIGTEVGHVTRDSDTTFKVKRSKVNLLLMSIK